MIRIIAATVAVGFAAVGALGQTGGLFAKGAEPITLGRTSIREGGKKVVAATSAGALRVTWDGRRLERTFEFGLNAAVLWSPDRRRFALTGSEGGASGQYRTAVVSVEDTRLVWFDLTPNVERSFGRPVKCGWPESPNVAAVVWQSNTNLVVAAQIINHSNCDSFGTFAAYDVDVVAQRVGRRYDQLEAKRRWSSTLGAELTMAPDECVRSPEACFVASNHPKSGKR